MDKDKIELIASDFNTLEEPCSALWDGGTGQYTINNDCPIARAVKRAGYPRADVTPEKVFEHRFNTHPMLLIDGSLAEVERCREELLAGAPAAYIRIVQVL